MGMNMELKRAGRAFHIQTEDLGVSRGELVSQLFVSGSIVETVRSRYFNPDELPPRPPPPEAQLRHQMRDQHLSLVRAVQAGQYDLTPIGSAALPLTPPPLTNPPPTHQPHAVPERPLTVSAVTSPVISRPRQATLNVAKAPQVKRATPTHLDRALSERETQAVQRGAAKLGREALLSELLCLPQQTYPETAAPLLELKARAQQTLEDPTPPTALEPQGDS